MKEEGEAFTDDELSEMWKAAVQDGKQLFMYHDFVPSMLEESKVTITWYTPGKLPCNTVQNSI